jgi:hypothetical protein
MRAGYVFQQVRRGPIALARRGFELLAINDCDVATVIGDQAGLLQGAGDHSHGRPACSEHHCDEFLRQREVVAPDAVVRHQQPTREPLLDRKTVDRGIATASDASVALVGPPAWLVGPVVAIAALLIFGIEFALFPSGGGILIAAGVAFWIGAGVAGMVDPDRPWRNTLIVAVSIVVWLSAYLTVVISRAMPPGSQGGPNVPMP